MGAFQVLQCRIDLLLQQANRIARLVFSCGGITSIKRPVWFWMVLMAIFFPQLLNSQCDITVGGSYFYCSPGSGADRFWVGFSVSGTSGTYDMVDLEMNNANAIRVSINNPDSDVSWSGPISFTSSDTIFYVEFGWYSNNDDFEIILEDTSDPTCQIPIHAGSYSCGGQEAGDCDTENIRFYEFDFTSYSLPSATILDRNKRFSCCEDETGDDGRCHEFRFTLGPDQTGVSFDETDTQDNEANLYYAQVENFDCDSLQVSNDNTFVCFEYSSEYYVFNCTEESSTHGILLSPIYSGSANVQDFITTDLCEIVLDISSSNDYTWSSPDDPGLLNLDCGSGPGITIECGSPMFLLDTMTFGRITSCSGSSFTYIASNNSPDQCGSSDADTFDVIVLPDFNVTILPTCNNSSDSLMLTSVIGGNGSGCNFEYLWNTGDTTASIVLDTLAGVDICVSVFPFGIESNCVVNVCYTTQDLFTYTCENLIDSLLDCAINAPPPDTSLLNIAVCSGSVPLVYVTCDTSHSA